MIPEQVAILEAMEIRLLPLKQLGDRPEALELHSSHFILLLMADTREMAADQIGDFSEWCLKQGMVYLCAWGPDCERVHDIADEVLVMNEIALGHELSLIMTTWHTKDELKDVLWFALHSAFPDEIFVETCKTLLIVTLNNPGWESQVRELFKQTDYFPG